MRNAIGYIFLRYIRTGIGYIFVAYIRVGYMFLDTSILDISGFFHISYIHKKIYVNWIYPDISLISMDIAILDISKTNMYVWYIHGFKWFGYIKLDISMDLSKSRIYPWIYQRFSGYIHSKSSISINFYIHFLPIIGKILSFSSYIQLDIRDISTISMDISVVKSYILVISH